MQSHAADKLNIEGNHIPFLRVFPYHKLGPHHAPTGIFHDRKYFRKIIVQYILGKLFKFFLGRIYLIIYAITFTIFIHIPECLA
ncbi:hypothetical protein DSECCO2_568060 [anaerobic digester metagenome]